MRSGAQRWWSGCGAVSVSLLVHAVAMGGFSWWAARPEFAAPASGNPAALTGLLGLTALPADLDEARDLTYIDLAPEVLAEATPLLPDPATAAGDETRAMVEEAAPRLGDSAMRAAPAPDSGDNQGRALDADPAFRRDRQTAKAILTDGSSRYQASRAGHAAVASSPQAVRREPEPGLGDVVRGGLQAAAVPVPEEMLRETAGDEPDAVRVTAASERIAAVAIKGTALLSGLGGPAVAEGARAFDADLPGRARDVTDLRAASDERAPAPIEYSAPSANGPETGLPGRGAATAPGVSAAAVTGAAPTLQGARAPVAEGAEVVVSTVAEARSRHEREIERRAGRVLRFPKRMALMLEQGETIIEFLVGADGRLRGPVRVVKSSGFAEFDDEAVGAVQRAAPFPAMSAALTVKMRIPFKNPVVR